MNDTVPQFLAITLAAVLAAATALNIGPQVEKAKAEAEAQAQVAQGQHLAFAKAMHTLSDDPRPATIPVLAEYLDAETATGGHATTADFTKGWEQDSEGYFTHPTTAKTCATLERAGMLNGEMQCIPFGDGFLLRVRYTQQ